MFIGTQTGKLVYVRKDLTNIRAAKFDYQERVEIFNKQEEGPITGVQCNNQDIVIWSTMERIRVINY